MTIRVLFIPADEDCKVEFKELPLDTFEQLKKAQELVGGYIERTRSSKFPELDFWVNEEGMLRNLVLNVRAAAFGVIIYGDCFVTKHANTEFEDFPYKSLEEVLR